MTGKDFFNRVSNGSKDIVQQVLDILGETRSSYCVIGGLAVNAYVEPVVSLDLDVVVGADGVGSMTRSAQQRGLKVEQFEHSVNLSSPQSDLRVQVQTDPRYQAFIPKAAVKEVLGYHMRVASLEDVLQGKVWAYMDQTRRPSKRQKDLADIARLVEAYPELMDSLPPTLREHLGRL